MESVTREDCRRVGAFGGASLLACYHSDVQGARLPQQLGAEEALVGYGVAYELRSGDGQVHVTQLYGLDYLVVVPLVAQAYAVVGPDLPFAVVVHRHVYLSPMVPSRRTLSCCSIFRSGKSEELAPSTFTLLG